MKTKLKKLMDWLEEKEVNSYVLKRGKIWRILRLIFSIFL